ncbi:hypothetical protein FSP39_004094 [Pinctada imbricata]|uniref:Ig-like domain-containing protein n=1 Tax=Pinctada imbricata TaxID=66713 RepID=A0AA89C6F1_PINIB|nr:hypothetical protein FSP39_004094 [Pinctada imbricata]
MKILPDSDVTYYYENGRTNPVVCTAVCNPTCRIYWKDPYRNTLDGNTLRLGNASRSMNGTYTCIAENVIASLSYSSNTSIEIIVYYPCEIERWFVRSTHNVDVGADVTINCPIEGNPEPLMTWSKDGKNMNIDTTEKYLQLRNVSCEDSGEYTCTADNNIGQPVSQPFNVSVLCEFYPRFVFTSFFKSLYVNSVNYES